MKTFNIVKVDSHKKDCGVWVQGEYVTVLATITAKNRREAFAEYTKDLTSYQLNKRLLTGVRKNHNKKRRVEILTVEPAEQAPKGFYHFYK